MREPNVEVLKSRVTVRQFQRWRAFDKRSPIDSELRFDAAIARLAVVAIRMMGNKDVDFADFLPYPLKDEDAQEQRKTGRASKRAPAGLDPEILKAITGK